MGWIKKYAKMARDEAVRAGWTGGVAAVAGMISYAVYDGGAYVVKEIKWLFPKKKEEEINENIKEEIIDEKNDYGIPDGVSDYWY